MINDLGGATSSLVKLALDGTVLRHQVIANNISNANADGFQAQRLSFEQHLAKLSAETPSPEGDAALRREIDRLRTGLENGAYIEKTKDQSVELDQSMAELSANVLHYQALLEGISKRSSVIKMAITGEMK